MSNVLKSLSRCSAILANVANNLPLVMPPFAHSHAKLMRFCGLNSSSRRTAALVRSASSEPPCVAIAHAALTKLCGGKSLSRRVVAPANAANSLPSYWRTAANAHAVFGRCCELKSATLYSTALASAANSF
eukprot:gnl/TRDRNA2_/TRDRNA2_173422_c2_seq7.p1 gnl/TRDRNA2_/TRDRNA2_173422_c2~~gnl/TRDRNA2_/TRDRNA2_173422_c2_seq7.p1  ORF type:complete len:131 (-),score=11.31 gnl/TRDRNA2_/TRDRNA2_173422_c2_seq7:73-465(-)